MIKKVTVLCITLAVCLSFFSSVQGVEITDVIDDPSNYGPYLEEYEASSSQLSKGVGKEGGVK